ncbi:MAG: HAMP domain-containing sensor histidine kinase [Phycisphaerae bacterium]|jgi:signal transduction histidine kinase
MTLAKRMTIKIVGLVASLSVLGAVTTWGLAAARRSTVIARDEYLELRLVLDVDEHLFGAREALVAADDASGACRELDAARERLDEFQRFQATQHRDKTMHEEDEDALLTSLGHDLDRIHEAASRAGTSVDADLTATLAVLDNAHANLRGLSAEMDERIARAQLTSDRTIRGMAVVLGSVCLLIVLVTVVLSATMYRSIVVPLRRLATAVRRIAAGQFDERVDALPKGEFAELARDFNQMASKLKELYDTLETRVRDKSRELVRSERLASVGYLAAGVAHEINSPLGIITGHAEVMLKRLQRNGQGGKGVNVEETLQIIRDEAFRCKEITEKLLSLAAGRELIRERIDVRHIVDDVVSILGTLPQYRDRKLAVHVEETERLLILGNETELRQVVLNLAINALEAVQPTIGEVRFDGRRSNGAVELIVSDNGRGMTEDTLEHVFEPFFTRRGGATPRGTGLGLSITHAIIEAHGGNIRAESDGPNAGSRFFIELPVAGRERDS